MVHAKTMHQGYFRFGRYIPAFGLTRRVFVRHFLAALLLAFLASGIVYSSEPPPAPESETIPITEGTVRVGDIAPDFKLTTLDGKPVRLQEICAGKITLVVFWSYFCFPCQAEMPELEAFYSENEGNVAIVAVALDGPQYDNFILPFIAEHKLTMPIAYDRETDKFYETAEKYGVIGTPTFFILDDSARVRFIHLGRLEKSLLKGMVDAAKSKSYCSEIIKPQVGAAPPPQPSAQPMR